MTIEEFLAVIDDKQPPAPAKELAAFREAYKDRADALLPPDLRDSKR